MTEQDTIISGRNIHKTYHTGEIVFQALRGVDLSVNRGEMVAIMGASGSGKTTLLNCLSGLDDIDEGNVVIGGVELSSMSDDQITRYRATRMGYVFQAFNLLPVLTAVENVEMPMLVSGSPTREARRMAMDSLDLVGLADWASHYPAALSGGQQQRVTIARALVNQPEIVWADEPTGNLDSTNSEEIMQLLTLMNRENDQTFVVVTHSTEVAEFAHRTVTMADGLIVQDGARLHPGTTTN